MQKYNNGSDFPIGLTMESLKPNPIQARCFVTEDDLCDIGVSEEDAMSWFQDVMWIGLGR